MSQVRIVVADDHEVVREGIKALLHRHPNFHIVAEASTGEQAIEKAIENKPDIVLMDIRMPGMSGVDACRQITEQLPDTRVILLTSFAEDDLLFAAVRAGAAGYILKRIGNDDLVRTIEAVARGESRLDPALTEAMFQRVRQADNTKEGADFAGLSHQELRILVLIADGLTNREIAARLFLGEGTVRNYVSNVLNKLHIANRAEAAAFAVQHKAAEHIGSE